MQNVPSCAFGWGDDIIIFHWQQRGRGTNDNNSAITGGIEKSAYGVCQQQPQALEQSQALSLINVAAGGDAALFLMTNIIRLLGSPRIFEYQPQPPSPFVSKHFT